MANILLLEPDLILGKTYSQYLESLGHNLNWQQSAQAAVQALDGFQAQLAIIELQIAGHNGLEFLYEIRSYPDLQKLPVIIQSVVGKSTLQPNVMEQLQINAYLHKPSTSLVQLGQAVDSAARSSWSNLLLRA